MFSGGIERDQWFEMDHCLHKIIELRKMEM